MKGIMNSIKPLVLVSLLAATGITGCMTVAVKRDITRASSAGFVPEVDEPSIRGALTLASPEQADVQGRFTLSPDGKYIVFSARQEASSYAVCYLWKTPIAGGAPTKLTSGGEVHCTSPSFTADGKKIVYCAGGVIWKIRQDGAGGRTRLPGSGMGKDMSPNVSSKDKILFCSVRSSRVRSNTGYYRTQKTHFIWTCGVNGSDLTQMREGRHPMWSPDGSLIVFSHKSDIWSMKEDGTELMQLTNTPDFTEGIPSFSANGTRIIFTSNESEDRQTSKDFNIWTMNPDGSEKSQITELNSWDSWPIWGKNGIFFLSGRASRDSGHNIQKIWRIQQKAEAK